MKKKKQIKRTIYYVHPLYGKDENSGLSIKNPFQSFSKIMDVAAHHINNGTGADFRIMDDGGSMKASAKRSPNKRKRKLKRAAVR